MSKREQTAKLEAEMVAQDARLTALRADVAMLGMLAVSATRIVRTLANVSGVFPTGGR